MPEWGTEQYLPSDWPSRWLSSDIHGEPYDTLRCFWHALLTQLRKARQHGRFCAGGASVQSHARAVEAPVIPQEKARLAASLFGNSSSAEPARVRRSPNRQVGLPASWPCQAACNCAVLLKPRQVFLCCYCV